LETEVETNTMYRVYYDKQDVFAGISPIPFIGREVQHNGPEHRMYSVENISLNGKIFVECESGSNYDELWNKRQLLLDRFSKQFKDFYITSGDDPIFSGEVAVVNSISFSEAPWAKMVDYAINLSLWDQDSFTDYYGVIDQSDSIEFSDDTNGTIGVNRNISAQGIQTSARTAYENARNYVESKTGIANITIQPVFINSFDYDKMILVSEDVRVDRIGGSYSVSQGFVYDDFNDGFYNGAVVRTNMQGTSGDGDVNVVLNGTIEGGIECEMQTLRDAYSQIDPYAIANDFYTEKWDGTLFDKAVSFSSQENKTEKNISFAFTFSDAIEEDVSLIDSFSVQKSIQAPNPCVSADCQIKANWGPINKRMEMVDTYFSSFNIQDFIDEKWLEYGYFSEYGDLPSGLSSYSMTRNEMTAVVNVGGGKCYKHIDPPKGFDTMSYSWSVAPASHVYIEHIGLERRGSRVIQKLHGKTRSKYSIQGNAAKNPCFEWSECEEYLRNRINELFDEITVVPPEHQDEFGDMSDPILTSLSFATGISDKKHYVSFSASWSVDGGAIFDFTCNDDGGVGLPPQDGCR